MFLKNIPLNTSGIYFKHTLYDGCQLYIPLIDENEKELRKAQLRAFNSLQIAENSSPPEVA